MQIVYVVISNGKEVILYRFSSEDGPVVKIARGELLPIKLQRRFYGPHNWEVIHVFHKDDSQRLEGIRLISGGEIPRVLHTMLSVGVEVARNWLRR